MATEDEYQAKTHEALDKLWAQIDELKKEANEASAEARERFDKAIDALQRRQAETKSSWTKLPTPRARRGRRRQSRSRTPSTTSARNSRPWPRDRRQRAVSGGGGEGRPARVPGRVEEAAGRAEEAPRHGVTGRRELPNSEPGFRTGGRGSRPAGAHPRGRGSPRLRAGSP